MVENRWDEGLPAMRTWLRPLAAYDSAIGLCLLFAFLPYHFMRGLGHLFLASYFLIPLLVLLALRLYLDQSPFCRRDLFSRRTLGAVLLCLLAGSGGVYYAFFACYFLFFAG